MCSPRACMFAESGPWDSYVHYAPTGSFGETVFAHAVLRLQLANGTQQNLDGFMIQFNKNAHSLAPVSQVTALSSHLTQVCNTETLLSSGYILACLSL